MINVYPAEKIEELNSYVLNFVNDLKNAVDNSLIGLTQNDSKRVLSEPEAESDAKSEPEAESDAEFESENNILSLHSTIAVDSMSIFLL